MLPIISTILRYEEDVVAVRQRSRQVAGLLGFDPQDQTRIATAVSEIARNALHYGDGGRAEFAVEGRTSPQVLLIRISDAGPGIAELSSVLEGRYLSSTGMGLGILGARRLMDQFQIDSSPGKGTVVHLRKLLPRKTPLVNAAAVARLAEELGRAGPRSALEEVRTQNQELLHALDELRRRQEELMRLNHELEDTNRGVVALYSELDEKADHLRRADELKTKFLSNMSHEFRTPLNSILGLCRLLLEGGDGRLGAEQEKQVEFIKRAAEELSQVVNDLLDLAKVEAGKIAIHPLEFEVEKLFGALRGMLRPLLLNESVSLIFEDASHLPSMYTDEGKVSQILRNFISNALKYTERGEIRVSANLAEGGEEVEFAVADTGIGIPAEYHDMIFHEFTQVNNPLQKKSKGTGLGLPLCRKLAGLLGGTVRVKSEPGAGSTFYARVPRVHQPAASAEVEGTWEVSPGQLPVLVVEDNVDTVFIYQKYLNGSGFQLFHARSLAEARRALAALRPEAIVLDIYLRGEDTWEFLSELKREEKTRDVPVLVVTTSDDVQKCKALGADGFCIKPAGRKWVLDQLRQLTRREARRRVLIIDDDEVSRYLLRQVFHQPGFEVLEASSGPDGLRRAQEEAPAAIFLDLRMPEMDGFEVLDRLKSDPATRDVPVIVVTSMSLHGEERRRLEQRTVAVLSKETRSRQEVLSLLEEALTPAARKVTS